MNKLYASIARHLNAPDLKPKLNDLDFDIDANTPGVLRFHPFRVTEVREAGA